MADWITGREALYRAGEAFRAAARTVSSAYLGGFRGPLVPTGVCPVCQLRVPVLRTGRPARHWPRNLLRRARLVPARGDGRLMVTVCAGSEIEPAGYIVIDRY